MLEFPSDGGEESEDSASDALLLAILVFNGEDSTLEMSNGETNDDVFAELEELINVMLLLLIWKILEFPSDSANEVLGELEIGILGPFSG